MEEEHDDSFSSRSSDVGSDSSFTTTGLLDSDSTHSTDSFTIDQDHEYRMVCKEMEETTKQQKEQTKQQIETTKQKQIVLEIYKEKVKLRKLKRSRHS